MGIKNMTNDEIELIEEYRRNKTSIVIEDDGYTNITLYYTKGKLQLTKITNCHNKVEDTIILAKNKSQLKEISDFIISKLNKED